MKTIVPALSRSLATLALASCAVAPFSALAAAPEVVPAVRTWSAGTGVVVVDSGALTVVTTVPELAAQAARLKAEAASIPGTAAVKGAAGVTLALAGSGAKLPGGDEAYRVTVAAPGIVITGNTVEGVIHGTRVFLQLLKLSPSGLPAGVIDDAPDYAHRMLMLDVGRKPFPISVLKDYIRVMAWYRMNELHLHFSDEAFGGGYAAFRIESKKFPGLASKDLFYTHAEIRELQDFARSYGVLITPEFDMPGHARCFTNYWPDCMLKGYPNYLDVTNPKSIEHMKDLLDEMIPLFDAPDIHIGTDEYRVGNRPDLHEAFRQFINTMNAHIRSRGKNTRIWSGFEHMKGTTQIDPTVTIDMWETDDAKSQVARGHKVINSNHGRTYIVPGAHYYGISPSSIYESWEPWMVSKDVKKNPEKNDPHLLGGKLHVWADHGPTGFTMKEIADLTMTGVPVFAEKLWGVKGSANFKAFTPRAAAVFPVPGVKVFDRVPADKDGVVLDLPAEQTLADENAVIALPLASAENANLEYPWTLTLRVKKTGDSKKRGVLIASELSEVCTDYERNETVTTKFADGTPRKTTVKFNGLGIIRAAGYYKVPGEPSEAYLAQDLSASFKTPVEKDRWTTVTLVGEKGRCTAYLDGKKVGETRDQQVCPLRSLGSKSGNSFVGKISHLKVLNRALTAEEVAAAAK